jgi:hypothetical protein
MGDWPKRDLVGPDGLYPHLNDAPCAGCGGPIAWTDKHCYADWDHIWHAECWPRVLKPQGEDGPRDA